jgi:aminobutyraldehyde dehydrogenase
VIDKVMRTSLLIDGKLIAGEGEALEVLDPATGAVIARVPEASLRQLDAAVSAAAGAFPRWSRTSPQARSIVLLKLADRIETAGDELARLESLNCGKPLTRMVMDEIPATLDVLRFYAGAARCMSGPLANEYLPGFTSMIRRDPLGAIGAIVPWIIR